MFISIKIVKNLKKLLTKKVPLKVGLLKFNLKKLFFNNLHSFNQIVRCDFY